MDSKVINVIDTLKQLYASTISAEEDRFFIVNLSDYINYVNDNPLINVIIKNIENKKAEDYKLYYQLKPKAKEELEASKGKIYKIIDKFNLRNEEIIELQRRIEMWGEDESTLNFDLLKLYEIIPEKYKGDFLKQHANINYIFSRSLESLHNEEKKIEYLKISEFWHCWYKIKFIPRNLRNSKLACGEVLSEDENDYFFEAKILLLKILKRLPRSYKDGLVEYKNCFARLHNYFIIELNNKSNSENKIKEIYIYKGGYSNYALIVVGENKNKLIEPTSAVNDNSWVVKLYKIAENGSCEYSKNIEAINHNKELAIYSYGYFTKTKILTKKENVMIPAEDIKIVKIRNKEEFNKKRKKLISI